MDHQSQSRYSEEEYPDSYDKPTGSQRNTQPGFRHQGYLTPLTSTSRPYVSPYPPTRQPSESSSLSQKPKPSRASTPGNIGSSEASSGRSSLVTAPMSTYSSSSQESTYSSPAPQQYKLVSPGMMSNPKSMTSTEKEQLLRSLRTHRVNTLTDLRRIEKITTSLNSPEFNEAMKNAWDHYVNSNNLLNELRGLTKSYPFSSECLDEAKWQVIGDPASTRTRNFCWSILARIRSQNLIPKHARTLAARPAMWGGRTPTTAGVEKLATACVGEWTRAVSQMLRNWD